MASTSTSSVPKSFKYDVFLSFRGEDTRTNFVDHLYYALKQKSINIYKDDEEMKRGKLISDELIRSIEDSRFYIIVFSKNYASSSWCLDELVKIMECQKMNEHTAFPVFYDVEPTEVHKQIGAVGDAFRERENGETARKWKEALKEAADLSGWELNQTANGHEAKFIQKIVEDISLELRSINFCYDENLVGMDTRVKDFISFLEIDVDDVSMIGIKGMGGGGKTTLARAVFDQISFQFEGKSFVENVWEVSNASASGLKSLQKQVLSDILNDQGINISGVFEGKNMMKRMMCGRKVLLVLDDVDDVEQLEVLAGGPNWFKPGSRIIITTRDEKVLVAHQVKRILNVNLLLDNEAISLFSKYAFGREIPIQGYEELYGQVVSYAGGLPLTIKVLGSFLCGKNKSEWIDALERLKTIPLKETLQKLELSYDSLEGDYKEIFLNVACILKGWSKNLAIEALESCGFHAINGLRVLEKKCLITVSHDSKLYMHDHIEEMGRNIVRRSHQDKPKKYSRLWIDEEIQDIFANDLGTKATRYIRINLKKVNLEIVMKGLRKMRELRFLYVSPGIMHDISRERKYNNFSHYFPNALQYLHWSWYPLWSLPNTFKGNNLVALKMSGCKIVQLWEGGERKVLNKLKFLDLNFSNLTTLDFGLIPNLEVLSLGGCRDLVQIHMLDQCQKLISVDLSNSKLKTVDLRSSVNLDLLHLKDCFALEELHFPNRCLKLKSADLSNSKLKTVDLRSAVNLELLYLNNCNALVELHLHGCLKLTHLHCTMSKLMTLDMPGECLNLRSLEITDSKLRILKIGVTPNLEHINLRNCYNLEELHMAKKCQKLVSLDISHSKLKILDLEECKNLVQLYVPIGCLEKLVYLRLSGCLRFTSFVFDKRKGACHSGDESLEVGPLAELLLIAQSLKICPLHPDNTFPKFQFDCFYKDDPSLTNRNLERLISVGLCACTNLETFSGSICRLQRLRKLILEGYLEAPKDIGQLESLEELCLSSKTMKHLPDSICMLKHLRFLDLKNCFLLEKLPEDLGQLECLEELHLWYTKIKHLPDSICMLKHMKSLDLFHCSLLEKLPENLGRLACLLHLTLSSSKIKHLPDTICMLKDLKDLKLDYCSLLEKLPEDVDRLEWLKSLELRECKSLRNIPISICNMKRLERLDVSGTCISQLPHNIRLLKGLRIKGSRGLLEPSGFTSEIKTSWLEDTCYVDL